MQPECSVVAFGLYGWIEFEAGHIVNYELIGDERLSEEGVDGGFFGAEDGEGLGGGVAEVEAAEVHVEGPDEVGIGWEGDGFRGEGYRFVAGEFDGDLEVGAGGHGVVADVVVDEEEACGAGGAGSDAGDGEVARAGGEDVGRVGLHGGEHGAEVVEEVVPGLELEQGLALVAELADGGFEVVEEVVPGLELEQELLRSEEHTSELQ